MESHSWRWRMAYGGARRQFAYRRDTCRRRQVSGLSAEQAARAIQAVYGLRRNFLRVQPSASLAATAITAASTLNSMSTRSKKRPGTSS